MDYSQLAEYLDLTDEELEEIGLDEDDIFPDTGNSGDMIYSYYFNVPEQTPQHILEKKGWVIGERVEIDRNFFDDDDSEED